MIFERSKSGFVVLPVATWSSIAIGQLHMREVAVNGQRQVLMNHDGDQRVDPATLRAYDNWRYPGGGGNTLRRGLFQTGSDEAGDDLQLASGTEGIVNDLGWSVAHCGTTGSLSALRVIKRFYDANTMALLYTDDAFYTFVGTTIRPGEAAKIYSDGGLYRSLNIPAPQSMFMTLQFADPVGMDVADLGIGYGGPINTGSSSSFIRNFTTGQNTDLGADPQNNLLFFIDSVVVPSPSSVSLLAASSLLAFRRRRK